MLLGVRLHRPAHRWPWWTPAAGLLTFTTGDTYYNVMEGYSGDSGVSSPFPSPADAFCLATYPPFAAGLYGLIRRRWAGHDLPSLLDALIFTAGLALPVWVYLVQPLAEADGPTWQQRAISIACPLGVVLVPALLLTPGPVNGHNRSVQLLVVGSLTLLGFGTAYGILQLNSVWQAGTPLDSGWIVFYTAWGLAALHPSMTALTAAVPQKRSPLPPPHRLLMPAAVTFIAPAILLYEAVTHTAHHTAVIAAFSAVLFLLVILRLAGMVVAHRGAMAREPALRRAAGSLVSAIRQQEVARSCEAAVDMVLGPEIRHRTRLLSAEEAAPLLPREARRVAPRRPRTGHRRPAGGAARRPGVRHDTARPPGRREPGRPAGRRPAGTARRHPRLPGDPRLPRGARPAQHHADRAGGALPAAVQELRRWTR
ncbi:hypothetical protein ACFYZ8_08315 [Streptomyces sp. NPDC001668]|uniref:hypothetical protein n=1 Tax=unclassified Streptomyces TaxID=2593676 RepID=UPI0036CA0974